MSKDTVARSLKDNVLIEGVQSSTGAHAVAPEARGRVDTGETQYVPSDSVIDHQLQREVEHFLFHQAAVLDAKQWQTWIDLFTADGVYWMPVELGQTDWMSEPSIFAEDQMMMTIRKDRMLHPNAWSQAPMWGTNHMVGNVIIESATDSEIKVYSRFQMMELRRDDVRHFAGTYQHTLVRQQGEQQFGIKLQRVDMMNGQAAYDYVLQAWV